MHRARVIAAHFVAVDAVEPDSVRIGIIGFEIGERRGDAAGVPFLAVHRAGMTADADIEIDHQTETRRAARVRERGHDASAFGRNI